MTKSILDLLPEFPNSDGDKNDFAWSTRLPKIAHQLLLDFKSDYNLRNNSETLRRLIAYALERLPEEAKEHGINVSEQFSALSMAMKTEQEFDQRIDIQRKIIDLTVKAAETENVPMQLKLITAAKGLAETFGFVFPPPDLPLTTVDLTANRVLELVKKWLVRESTDRLTLNFLNHHSTLNADELKASLTKLSDEGYLTLEVDDTGPGRERIWIMIDSVSSILGVHESHI